MFAKHPDIAERWVHEAKESGSPIVQALHGEKKEKSEDGTLTKALKGK